MRNHADLVMHCQLLDYHHGLILNLVLTSLVWFNGLTSNYSPGLDPHRPSRTNESACWGPAGEY